MSQTTLATSKPATGRSKVRHNQISFDKNKCLTIKILFMKNLENYGVQEMNANEVKKIDGGAWIKFTGFLDGIKGNTKICFFC